MEALDECDDELVAEMEKYPNLNKYFRFFIENPGDTEDPGFLPRLIGWIRTHVDAYDLDAAELFDMDEDTAEDFYTWGHNSRWANTFTSYIECDPNLALERCLRLARRYGDPAIGEIKE